MPIREIKYLIFSHNIDNKNYIIEFYFIKWIVSKDGSVTFGFFMFEFFLAAKGQLMRNLSNKKTNYYLTINQ